MYAEEDFAMLSALQHFIFCPRQCALIHIEQVWEENQFTAEGRIMHENPDGGHAEKRRDFKIARGLLLNSHQLGLSGKADVVEFYRQSGKWIPFPVEYKRGKPKRDNSDKIQLCAQAICLEEMLKVSIPRGALFYGKTRHRFDVEFESSLRAETQLTAERLHGFIRRGKTPKAEYSDKCEACSLVGACIPKTAAGHHSVKTYLSESIREEAA